MRRKNGFVLSILDDEFVDPLAFSGIENILLVARRIEGSRKPVFLSRDPSFTTVINLGGISGRGGDVGRAVQFDVGRTRDEAFDVQRGEGDKVVLIISIDMVDGMTDLLVRF